MVRPAAEESSIRHEQQKNLVKGVTMDVVQGFEMHPWIINEHRVRARVFHIMLYLQSCDQLFIAADEINSRRFHQSSEIPWIKTPVHFPVDLRAFASGPALCWVPADLTSGSEISPHIEVSCSGVLYILYSRKLIGALALSLMSYHIIRVHFSFSTWQPWRHKQSHSSIFKFKVISIYSMLHCWSIHLSLPFPPHPLSLIALIPWSNQGYTAAVRIHIILHFNHMSIDLHLLNIMIIERLVLLIPYGSLEQDFSL